MYYILLSGSDSNGFPIYAYLSCSDKICHFVPTTIDDDKISITDTPLPFVLIGPDGKTAHRILKYKQYYLAHPDDNKFYSLNVNEKFYLENMPTPKSVYLEVFATSNFGTNDIRGRSFIKVADDPLLMFINTDIINPRLSLIEIEDGKILPKRSLLAIEEIQNVEPQEEKKRMSGLYAFFIIFIILIILALIMIAVK